MPESLCLHVAATLLCGGGSLRQHLVTPSSAIDILRANEDTMLGLKSYRAKCFIEVSFDDPAHPAVYNVATLVAEKPNKMRYDLWLDAGIDSWRHHTLPKTRPGTVFACDGQTEISQVNDHY